MPDTCPLCNIMAYDYRVALAEAEQHPNDSELLLEYALEVGQTLYQHIQSHLDTPPARSALATGKDLGR